MSAANDILVVQVGTLVAPGALFPAADNWRLGLTQLLLAVIQGLVYAS